MMPVLGAVEAYMAIYNALPYSVSSLIDLVIAFSFVAGIIGVILKL